MAQITVYATANDQNWDATNGWTANADGSGTAYTNPQNGGGTTYLCDLNAKTNVNINVAVSVDQIRTGATNAGGTLAVPNSTAAVITVATASSGLYSNYAGSMVAWGTGTCSLTINGSVTYASTSTAGMLPVGTSQTITINGQGAGTTAVTNSSSGYVFVGSGSGALAITNTSGNAWSQPGSGRVINWGSSGAVTVIGSTSTIQSIGLRTSAGSSGCTATFPDATDTHYCEGWGSFCEVATAGSSVSVSGDMNGVHNTSGWGTCASVTAGTFTWASGTHTIAAGERVYLYMNGASATITLTNATVNNSGQFLFTRITGTVNASGCSIVNQTATAQALIGNTTITVTGPTLPIAGDVRKPECGGSLASFGYAGALVTPSYGPIQALGGHVARRS